MLPKLSLFIGIFLIFSEVLVAHLPPPGQSHCKLDPKLPNIYRWFEASSAAHGKIYIISNERKSKILDNYSKLRLGMGPQEVHALLGSADYEDSGFRNSGFRPDGSRDMEDRCSAAWGYYFKKAGENLADLKDSILILEFNSDRKLVWAAPQNIPKLSTIGSPIK